MKVLSPRISGAVRRNNHRDRRPADREVRDLLSWCRHYLPSHFTKPSSPMHKWLAAELDELAANRGRKINLVGPRGHAKSTIATLAYPLRQILRGSEAYIWIVSDTAHQAQMHLENIRWELTDNERLAEDYSKKISRGQKWSAGSMRLASGVVVEAYGTGQRIRGKRAGAHRPSLIICDDLQNDGHIASVAQREASRVWFHGTLLRAGNSLTNVINLGTALHRDALAMELTRTPGWRTRTFAAIVSMPVLTDLWNEWERIYCDLANPQHVAAALAFYEAHRDEMHAGAEVLWPEEEDLYTLMRIRVESGRTAFEREKQSRPIDPERCEFPDEYFADHIWFDEWPDGLAVRAIALDPSKGTESRHGDYSAFVLLGMDHDGVFFVEAILDHLPTPALVDEGVRLAREFRPDVFGVEANLFQVLLAKEFQAAFNREGLLTVRVEPIDNHVAKIVRIRRLGRYLSQRRLRFLRNSTGARLVVDQLRDFPLGTYDDGPDALEMAERLADRYLLGRIAPNDGLGSRLI